MIKVKVSKENSEDKEHSPTFKVSIMKRSSERFSKIGSFLKKSENNQKKDLMRKIKLKSSLKITKFGFFDTKATYSPIHIKETSLSNDRSRCNSSQRFNQTSSNSFVSFKASTIRIQSKQNTMKQLTKETKSIINRNMIVIGKKFLEKIESAENS